MKVSCNGCRVLRKGCTENCSIRPCLEWMKSPHSQANATVFLAKFYGRAGLVNLLDAGPAHLRPAIFRSLLYEACGRIPNPVHGSLGLLSSASSWDLCQSTVESVLRGSPIAPLSSSRSPDVSLFDIRHSSYSSQGRRRGDESNGVTLNRRRKRRYKCGVESTSRESSVTHLCPETPERESFTVEASASDGETELELSLGLEPISQAQDTRPIKKKWNGLADATCEMSLGLDWQNKSS